MQGYARPGSASREDFGCQVLKIPYFATNYPAVPRITIAQGASC
jgi:hypothetical protein